MPLYVWNSSYGWLSNDKYVWAAWTFENGYNVDVSDSRWVKLARHNESVNTLFTNLQWKPMWLIEWSSRTNRIIASKNWILKTFTSSEDFNKTIYNISKITDRLNNYWLIFSSSGEIYKWTIDENSLDLWVWTNWVNITLETTLPLDTNWWSNYFDEKSLVFQKGNTIYVTAWNGWLHNIHELTLVNWSLVYEQFVTINLGYDIRYMTNIWNQIIIYASDWTNGKQYFWNWVSDTFDRVIDWYDKPILWWVTLNNIDYVIVGTWKRREMYVVSGYQPQKMYWTDINVQNRTKEKFFFDTEQWSADIFETIWETIIIPGEDCFYKYWDNKIGLPKNIVRNELFWLVNFIYYNDANWSYLTFWTQTSNYTWNFEYLLTEIFLWQPTPNSTIYPTERVWTLEWLKYIWDSFSQEKSAVKVRVWYKLPKTDTQNTSLNIYARTGDKYYANFYTYEYNWGSYTTAPSVWDIYSFDWVNWEVYDITIKKDNSWTANKALWLIIHCKTTAEYEWDKEWVFRWTLTKVSWAGQASFLFSRSDFGYKLLKKITDTTKYSDTFNLKDKMPSVKFNEINFKVDLITTDPTITPVFYDLILLHDIIENEI